MWPVLSPIFHVGVREHSHHLAWRKRGTREFAERGMSFDRATGSCHGNVRGGNARLNGARITPNTTPETTWKKTKEIYYMMTNFGRNRRFEGFMFEMTLSKPRIHASASGILSNQKMLALSRGKNILYITIYMSIPLIVLLLKVSALLFLYIVLIIFLTKH